MRLKLDETLADGKLEALILRLKKEFPEFPLALCADYVGSFLENLNVTEDDLQEFLEALQESSDEFDGLPIDDVYQISKDLEFLVDYPLYWDGLPPGAWVDELP